MPLRSRAALSAVMLGTLAATSACHPKSLKQAGQELVSGGVHVSTSETTDGPVAVNARLDCPESQGELTRTAQAADGRSCAYTSRKGVVELSLRDGGDDATAALAPLRAQLDAMLPGTAKGGTINVSSETGPDGRERANVDLPFLHVREDGKRSHVKILGMTIDSDNDDAKSHSHRSHGSPDGGRELVYVLASGDKTPDGYHAVGYVARGAARGPLVVGVFKYVRQDAFDSHSGHGHDNDLDALIDLNAKTTPSADRAKDDDSDTGDANKSDDG